MEPWRYKNYRERLVTRSHAGFQVGRVRFTASSSLPEAGRELFQVRNSSNRVQMRVFGSRARTGKEKLQAACAMQGQRCCLFGTYLLAARPPSAFLETIYRYTLRNGHNKLGTSQKNPRKTHRPILAVESKGHVERGWHTQNRLQTEEFALHEFVYNGPLHASLRKHMFKIELRKRAQVRIESLRGCAS